jgi:predicted nucleic acid-binding protein
VVDTARGSAGRRLIASDTSSLRRFLAGIHDRDTDIVDAAIERDLLMISPVVLTEALSDPGLSSADAERVRRFKHLPLHEGYWERAGQLRASVLMRGHKARLADCLVAQSCIDHDIPLITYDHDFRHFTIAGLQLIE